MVKDIMGNGQKIYVEPLWITGETCLFNITNGIEYLRTQSKVTEMRKAFLTKLEDMGYIIVCNKSEIDNDTICFVMNDSSVCGENENMYEYKKQFDQKMFESGGEKLNYPYTLGMEEYFNNPFFPAVLKNELENGGTDKFLIENQEQLDIIKRFYVDFFSLEKYRGVFECTVFQQYIETPTNHKTYLRVLMSASGDIMGASLKYSKSTFSKKELSGCFEPYFLNRQSEYFLNCGTVFNYYSDGGNIYFDQPKYSSEKQDILAAHDINKNNPTIPDDVLEVSKSIMCNCNQELGILCGIDFIFNKYDRKWYYLENQAFPAIDEWAVSRNIRLPRVKSIKDYIEILSLDLDARYEALMLYMKNIYEKNECKNRLLVKKNIK